MRKMEKEMSQPTAIVKSSQGLNYGSWSDADVQLIKDTVARGADNSEFKLFLYTANRYGLDPLVKQIWCIKYGNQPAAIFTSRDGFLSIAHRSGHFDGMETRAVKNDKGQLVAAICQVWRKDMSHPFTVEVSRNEYDTGKGNWQKMPETMLKKVAESQALRRAFDISGLYEPSEYDPAQAEEQAQQQRPAPTKKINDPRRTSVTNTAKDVPTTLETVVMGYKLGLNGVTDLESLEQLRKDIKTFVPEGHNSLNELRHLYNLAKEEITTGKRKPKQAVVELEPEPEEEEPNDDIYRTCPACDGPTAVIDGLRTCQARNCGLVIE